MSGRTCAAEGCENPVPLRAGQVGRPPIYCSPAHRTRPTRVELSVEVERAETAGDDSSRDFEVRLRRGTRSVVVARGLGRFSATALATDLRSVVGSQTARSTS